jgi:hypothetical protein
MSDESQSATPKTVRYDYLKSPDYKTVFSEGIIGGPTPRGMLFMAFWHERPPIPQQIVHEVLAAKGPGDGGAAAVKIGKELIEERVSRQAVIRETEFGVMMSLEAAESLYRWLDGNLKTMKSAKHLIDHAGSQESK